MSEEKGGGAQGGPWLCEALLGLAAGETPFSTGQGGLSSNSKPQAFSPLSKKLHEEAGGGGRPS